MDAGVDQRLQAEEVAGRLRHLRAAVHQEIVVHPDPRAAVVAAAERLILRDLVGMVDLAVVDSPGVDVEGMAEMLAAHHRAFEMPARCARPPRRLPFHLALLARRRAPPDREVLRMALARDGVDPAFALVRNRTRQAAIVRHARRIEIEPAVDQVAVLFDRLREGDHLRDVLGRDGPLGGRIDVEPRDVGLERLRIVRRDLPDRLGLGRGGLLHLVVAGIGVRGQMADIGDIDDMFGRIPLPAQHAPERIGEQEGAHVADMLIIVDRRPAGVDPHQRRIDRDERRQAAREAVVERERGCGHPARLQTGRAQSHVKGDGSLESWAPPV